MLDVKLGPLEFPLTITPTDPEGGEPFDVVTTPSEFARADEFVDTLRATARHSEAWLGQKMLPAVALLAAQREGRFKRGALSVGLLAEFQNAFSIADAPVAEGRDEDTEPDPTSDAPDEGQEA